MGSAPSGWQRPHRGHWTGGPAPAHLWSLTWWPERSCSIIILLLPVSLETWLSFPRGQPPVFNHQPGGAAPLGCSRGPGSPHGSAQRQLPPAELPRAPRTAPAEECTAPLAGHKGPFVPDPSLHRCSVISGTTVTDCIPAALPGHLRAGAPGPRLRLPRDKGAGQGLSHLPSPPCPFPRATTMRTEVCESQQSAIKGAGHRAAPRGSQPEALHPVAPTDTRCRARAQLGMTRDAQRLDRLWVWLQPLDKSWQGSG